MGRISVIQLPHHPPRTILATGTTVFFCMQTEGSSTPPSQGEKHGREKEVSLWGSGERSFDSASLKLEGKVSFFSAAKQCGCIVHTYNQTRDGNRAW